MHTLGVGCNRAHHCNNATNFLMSLDPRWAATMTSALTASTGSRALTLGVLFEELDGVANS
jgi:hypothetical protein